MSFSLSTSWNAFEFSSGVDIVNQIKDLGFKEIELSFSLDQRIVNDVAALVKNKQIKVGSLHNFCPVPEGIARDIALPDFYSLASTDKNERDKAVYFTKKSIDACRRLKAKALVLHCGRTEITDYTRQLIELIKTGKKDRDQYRYLKNLMQDERSSKVKPHLAAAIKSLKELANYAKEAKVALGLENRFYFRELPEINEFKEIFEKTDKDNLFYWHDTGHAQIMQDLGFVNSANDYLDLYKDRLLGIHLHDVKDTEDHLAPLEGKLDFAELKDYINKSTIKVIEAHYPATKEAIKKAKLYLEKVLG